MDHSKTNLHLLESADFKAKNGNGFGKRRGHYWGSMQMMGEEIIHKVLLSPWFKEEGKASPHSLAEAP